MQKVADRTDVRRPSHQTLRAELAHAYHAAYGKTCRHDTLTALEGIVRWLRGCERHSGQSFIRSVPQAARGIGWPVAGHARADRDRHRNSLVRRLDMLVELGVVESYEPLWKANREGRGILVQLRRDSSVGGAHLSTRRRMRGDSLNRRVSPPLREKSPCKASLVERGSRRNGWGAGARARAGHTVTAAAIEALQMASEDGGAELIRAVPWLVDLAPAVLLRAAAFVFAQRRSAGWAKHWHAGPGLKLSDQSRRQAEAAVVQLDRLGGRGAGAAAIIDLSAGGWRAHAPVGTRFPEPRTPGAIARALRREARRRAALHHRLGGFEPAAEPVEPVEGLAWD